MGQTCACLRSDSEISDFWSSLSLRKLPPADWRKIIKTKQDKTGDNKNIPENNWKQLVSVNIANADKKDIAEKIFVNAMNKSEAKLSQGYLLISLLFLCEKDLADSKAVKQAFIELSADYGFRNYFKVDEKGVYHITKAKLLELVSFYVDLISLFGVNFLFSGKKEVAESLQKIYSEDIQKNYIDNVLFKSYSDEYVSLDAFFGSQYAFLINDEGIRESLWRIYDKQELEKKAAETKTGLEKNAEDAKKKIEENKTETEKKVNEAKKTVDVKVNETDKKVSGGVDSVVEKAKLVQETSKDVEKTFNAQVEKLSNLQKDLTKKK
jgi:hypothetical protein